jgi:hypothetical protein
LTVHFGVVLFAHGPRHLRNVQPADGFAVRTTCGARAKSAAEHDALRHATEE